MTAKKKSTKNENPVKKSIPRRGFLAKIWNILGIIVTLELFAVIYTFLSGKGKPETKVKVKRLIEAGPVENFGYETVTPFRGGRFFLVRLEDGGFLAMSLRCTHLGCSVSWEENEHRFICPCHSSAFDITGNVLNPPAPTALDYYPVYIKNGLVKVDIGRINKRERFNKTQAVYV